MTTERIDPVPPPNTAAAPRRLRRRETDRVLGGVAGGIADYLNVDPLLVRVVFAGLMVFGLSGLLFYLAALLLIPSASTNQSILESMLARVGLRFGRTGMAVLIFLIVVTTGASLAKAGSGWEFRNFALFATAAVIIGIILLRWGETSRGGQAAASSTMANPETGQIAPPPTMAAAPARPEPRPREQSPLGWYVGAAVLVTVGLLALVGTLPGLHVTIGQYMGGVLAVLGLGLVVAAWWGRAQLLILIGLLLLPVAIASAFITVPLVGGFGEVEFRPQTSAEARSEYRLVAGDLRLDLTDLSATGQPVSIAASVGVGRLIVVVPADAHLQVDARVSGGRLWLPGSRQVGTWLAERFDRPEGTGVHLVLALEAGLGGVTVEMDRSE